MRIIKLGGFEGDSVDECFLTPNTLRKAKHIFKQMASQSKEPIVFRFGTVLEGAVLESLSLVETVIKSEIEAISEATGFLGSGGPIVYFVGKKRFALPTAKFSFHSFIYKVKGSWIIDDIQGALLKRRITNHNARFAQILRIRTTLSESEINNIVQRVKGRLVYSAEVAHQFKIVTKIVPSFN